MLSRRPESGGSASRAGRAGEGREWFAGHGHAPTERRGHGPRDGPYMAPCGRSDLFAFGAIVYEMASDRRAFWGSPQASLVVAIL
jgi:hypothetical protein